MPRVYDIFTPGDYPKYTYVQRASERLEQRLRNAVETPGEIVAISGPSKSGKTVLVERVIGSDNLITVTGAGIESAEALWNRVLDWMGAPAGTSTSVGWQAGGKIAGTAEGQAGVPLVASGKASVGAEASVARTGTTAQTAGRTGMSQVVSEIARSSFVLLIDDFHYMRRDIQSEVAKQMKEAARQGVKIITASVPHRAEDVVRANPELRGRVLGIDISYWTPTELEQIAVQGFPQLNLQVSASAVRDFAAESSGSPQLMQALCLQTALNLNVRETLRELESRILSEADITTIKEETSARTEYRGLVRKLHAGPPTRGSERKEFLFTDGTRGDVYRAVLLAIQSSPPRLSFDYKELTTRTGRVCRDDSPSAQSMRQSLQQMARITDDMFPEQRIFEWSEDDTTLDIVDPYFLYYLRWSKLINSLASQ